MDTRTLDLQILVDHELFMCVPQPHGCSLRAFIVTSVGFILLFYVCFNCFPSTVIIPSGCIPSASSSLRQRMLEHENLGRECPEPPAVARVVSLVMCSPIPEK